MCFLAVVLSVLLPVFHVLTLVEKEDRNNSSQSDRAKHGGQKCEMLFLITKVFKVYLELLLSPLTHFFLNCRKPFIWGNYKIYIFKNVLVK